MTQLRRLALIAAVAFAGGAGPVLAHTPLVACYEMGDGTILCEGGFSDGSSAAGVRLAVRDRSGRVLLEGTMTEDSSFVFDRPGGTYSVLLDAGAGHRIEIRGDDIY
ncbi:MAG: hypothetical protein ACOC3D_04475 [Pseudomonadota bacterium]